MASSIYNRLLLPLMLLMGLLLNCAEAYALYSAQANAQDTTINVYTSYTITIDRTTDSQGNPAPWNTSPVPAGSNITIMFPSQFNMSVGLTCPAYPSCYVSSRSIVIPNAYTTTSYPDVISVTINGVLNPSPAITTDEFSATVGNDYTVTGLSNLGQVTLTPAVFTSCAVSFTPGYVNRTGTMLVTITPKNTIPSNGYLQVVFPIAGYWANDLAQSNQTFKLASVTCTNQSSNVQSQLSCSGSLATKTVNVTNLFSSNVSNSFSFSFGGLTAPPSGEPVDTLKIMSFSSSYYIDECTSTIGGLIPNIINSFTVTPTTTMTVNKVVSLRFNATIVDSVSKSDVITITFPSGSVLTYVGVSTSPGTHITQMTSANTLQVTFPSTFKTQPSGVVFGYTFSNYTAPPSTQTTGAFTFTVSLNGYPKQTATSTLQAVASTLSLTVTPTNTEINKNTTYTLAVSMLDGISSSGRIKINFPVELGASFAASNCATLTGVNISSTAVVCSQPNSTSLLLSGFNASSGNIPAQTVTIVLAGVVNPSSTAPTGVFTITTYYSTTDDTLVATGTGGSITATASTITVASAAAGNTVVQTTGVTYTVSFTPKNNIPSGGIVRVGIPLAITANLAGLTSTSCLAGTTTLSTVSCNAASNTSLSLINFTLPSGAVAGTSFNTQIQSIFTNPVSTEPVSSFTVETFTSTGYLIDSVLTGISIAMATPAPFDTITLNRNSTTNNAVASYTFRLSQPSALSSGSKLLVTFPNEVVPQSSYACTDLAGISTSCSFAGQVLTVNLPSNAVNTNFGVVLTNVLNPPSLQPSGRFSFSSQTPTGYLYSRTLNNISVTNTQPSSFPTLAGAFSAKMFGSANNLTLTFTPTTPVTGWIIVTVADSFTVSTLSCLSYGGSCSASGKVLNISGSFNTGSTSITIAGLTSPNSVPSDYTSVISYDTSGFIIDSNTNTIIFSAACTLPCRTCSTTATTCTGCYNSTAISNANYYLSTNNSCVVSCPTGYYTDSTNMVCTPCSSPCITCQGSTINCTSCNTTSTFPYLNVTGSGVATCVSTCPSGMYADMTQVVPVCTNCSSPCKTCTALSVCLTCVAPFYMYNGICANSCPDNITIKNDVTMICDPCATVCATCNGTTTNCTTCSTTAALYNGNCVASCPAPLVIKNGLCSTCDSPCVTCVQTSTNCTSCDPATSTPHLLNNSCLASCPIKYFNTSSTSTCQSCAALGMNCDLCVSQTECSTTCNTGYVYLNGQCLGTVPSGYVNVSGMAMPCLGDCLTCSVTQANCTSCKTMSLSGNLCVSPCPAGTTSVSMVCTACTSPCQTCSGSTTSCLSCNPNIVPSVYLSGSYCSTTCPSGRYANDTNKECTLCVSPCSTCTTASSCLTCVATYSFFQNSCLTNCPSGYVSVNQICQPCSSPCGTCSITQTNCTSCLSTLSPTLYLTGNSCVGTCPDTFYGSVSTLVCTPCVSPCEKCTSISSCTSCVTGYALSQNSCLATCPSGYFSSNKICTQCATGCMTCSNAAASCLSCSSGYYMVTSTSSCVSTCPTGLYPDPITTTCVGCQSPCTTCTGTQTNCTACITGKYFLANTCVDACPTAYFASNGVCGACPTGCLTCLSSAVCTSCLSGYNTYQTLCFNPCPQPNVVVKNGVCTACTTAFCSTCTSGDYCTGCLSPHLNYLGQCLDACPDGFDSNGTNCLAKTATVTLNTTMSSSKLFPYPMTIGSSIVILVCCISKFINTYTFVWGGIYGLVAIFEVLAHGYFIYLLWLMRLNTIFDPLMYLAFGSLASLYFVGLLCLITLCTVFHRDDKFRNWLGSSGNKVTYGFFTVLSVLVSFKVMNVIFCKLFNFVIFKAKLEHISKFFCLHFMSCLALVHSFSALAAAGYTLYSRTSDTQDQLFIACVDLIVVVCIELILAIFNAQKSDDYFVDIIDGIVINKRFDVNDEDNVTASVVAAILGEKEKGNTGRYRYQLGAGADSDNIDILDAVEEKFDESSGLVASVQSEQPVMCAAPNPITRMPSEPQSIEPSVISVAPSKQYMDMSQQMYEILSSRSQATIQEQPSERSIISKRTSRVAPSMHEVSVQMNTPPKDDASVQMSTVSKNNVSIQLDYVPNVVNFRVVEKSIVTQSARPSGDDDIFREQSRISAREKELAEKYRSKQAELVTVQRLIEKKKMQREPESQQSDEIEESQLTELHEKEDFNRTEQLEQMGVQRVDQLLIGQKQKELPVEHLSNNINSQILDSELENSQNVSKQFRERNGHSEDEDLPMKDTYFVAASKDLKEQPYNQSKPLEPASTSSPLRGQTKLPDPSSPSRQIKVSERTISEGSEPNLDWFNSNSPNKEQAATEDKQENRFVLTKDEMIEGVSKLSEDGFEDIQQLKSEMQNRIIEEENESDLNERSPGRLGARNDPRRIQQQLAKNDTKKQEDHKFTSLAQINRLLAESSESLIDPDHVQTIPVKKGSLANIPQNLEKLAMRRLAFSGSMEESARESEDEVNHHPMYVKLQERDFKRDEGEPSAFRKGTEPVFSKQPSTSMDKNGFRSTNIGRTDEISQSKEFIPIEQPSSSLFTKKSNVLEFSRPDSPPKQIRDSNYLESSEQQDDLWQHPAYVRLEQKDVPLRKHEEDDTEYIYNKTESDGNGFQSRVSSAQTNEPIRRLVVKPIRPQENDTNDLNISFGKADWNSVSKDGTTLQKARRPRIQGDYLSESQVSGFQEETTEKDAKKDEGETTRKKRIPGLNYIESSVGSGDSMELRVTGLTGAISNTVQPPNRQRFIQSAGYRKPYKNIEEPIVEEDNPTRQRVSTHQFRSTNLESAKGPRKLVLSRSKEKLRALPYTSSQERLDGASRPSSGATTGRRSPQKKDDEERVGRTFDREPLPRKERPSSRSIEKRTSSRQKQPEEIPELLPRPAYDNQIKQREKTTRNKSKSREKDKTPRYKELERIYLEKSASETEE